MHAGWHDFGWVTGHKAWSKRPPGFAGGRVLGLALLGAVYLGWDKVLE